MKFVSSRLTSILSASAAICALGWAQAEPPEWSGNPDVSIVIKTLPGMMRYDVSELKVEPGAKVKLTLSNPDDLQHNLVVLKNDPKDRDGQKFAMNVFTSLGEKAIEQGWVPRGDPRIIVASQLQDPKGSEDLYFIAPSEPGEYPYVCTVPGHALLMRGVLKVQKEVKLLRELTYSVYEGNWSKIPDFSTLKPVEKGELKTGKIDLKVARKRKGSFGLVFEAKLNIETEEDYRFYLASDDGSRLIVDGEGIIDNDGVHPMGNPKEGMVRLQEGIHTIRVPYIEKGGNRGLSLAVKSKSLGMQDLSADSTKKKSVKAPPEPILLSAKNGEAVMHRAFMGDASPRAISVGYPGGVNLCWDADVMNLAFVWRGGFIDAASNWNGRGSGSRMAGYDQVKTAQGMSMQVLESLDEPWEPFSKATVKYERDTADPQKEISIFVKHPDYQFRGYRLDEKRFPTFQYDYQDLKVTDRSEPAVIDGTEALVRVVTIKGTAKPNTYFRIADTGTLAEIGGGWLDISGKMALKLEGAEPVIREVGDGKKELLVAIEGDTTLTLTYRWLTAVGGRVK